MNQNPQLDFHPDAESLSAFQEQALPEQEHGHILAHLATCSRCRQVVFLAQEAAPELEMEKIAAVRHEMEEVAAYGFAAAMAAAPMAQAASGQTGNPLAANQAARNQPGWWSSRWRIAWIPAAALSVIVGLAVLIHVRTTQPSTDLARSASQASPEQSSVPPQQAMVAEPEQESTAVAAKAKQKTASMPAKTPSANAESAFTSSRSNEFSGKPAPVMQPSIESHTVEVTSSAHNEMTTASVAPVQGLAAQTDAAETRKKAGAASSTSHAGGAISFNSMSAGVLAARTHDSVHQMQASRGASVPAAAAGPAINPAPSVSMPVMRQQLESTAENVAVLEQVALPSGLSAVSIVTSQHHTLAVDAHGALFLSEDAGTSWEPISKQWSGRAVAVRLQRGPNDIEALTSGATRGGTEESAKELGPEASANSPTPAPAFEMVNDSDLIWVSKDGKTWTAK